MQINYRALIKQQGRRGIYHAGLVTLRGKRGEVSVFFENILCIGET